MQGDDFAASLLAWHGQAGRHDLPWQAVRTPYRTWISEIMLQQTRVSTVIPFYNRFMSRFPDPAALAAAPLDEVLHLWSGLGYYARARNLHRAAQVVMTRHGGRVPEELLSLQALPGIGRSTAGAILAQACGQRHPILDGNVKRVLARWYAVPGWPGSASVERKLWQLADRLTPAGEPGRYAQAIMDLGATVCRRGAPDCGNCPVASGCEARRLGRQQEFPAARPKRPRPLRHTRMLLLRDATGALLLERRSPCGIWGGLWCPPELGEESATDWAIRSFGATIQPSASLPRMRHGFSHFELEIEPWTAYIKSAPASAMEQGRWVWYKADSPVKLGLAAAVQRLIDALPPLEFAEELQAMKEAS